jgi:hypothetical protein
VRHCCAAAPELATHVVNVAVGGDNDVDVDDDGSNGVNGACSGRGAAERIGEMSVALLFMSHHLCSLLFCSLGSATAHVTPFHGARQRAHENLTITFNCKH